MRNTAKHLGLLALVMLLFYWKTLLTNQFTLLLGEEGVNQTYSWLHFWVHSVWQGRFTLWDPYSFGGRPYTSEMAGFYPPHLMFALAPFSRDGLISPKLYNEYMALTHYLGGVFMFLALRQLRLTHFASLVGACAFSFGGIVAQMMWPQYVESAVWLPGVFLFILRALESKSSARAVAESAAAGLCTGMAILAGGIQFAMMQDIVAVSAIAYWCFTQRNERTWRQPALIAGVFVLTGIAVGAAQLIPSLEFSHYSVRWIDGGTISMTEKIPYARMHPGMWPQSILTALMPTAFGGKVGGDEAWSLYIGVLPLFFAIIGIWKFRGNPWVRYLCALAVLAFLYSLGEFSPLHGMIYATTPYLWLIRQSSRFVYLATFATATLAAFGADALMTLETTSDERDTVWSSAMPFLKWIAIIAGLAFVAPGIFQQLSLGIWDAFSLLLILAACGLVYRLTQSPASAGARFLVIALIVFDLSAFQWLPVNKDQLAQSNTDQHTRLASLRNAAEFIHARSTFDRVRVESDPEPAIGDPYTVAAMWGNGASWLNSYAQLRGREDLFNVRYRIRPAAAKQPGAIYQDSHWKVYEDPTAFPHAWITHKAIQEPNDTALFIQLAAADADLRNTAILEQRLPQPLESGSSSDALRFRSYDADSMALDVTSGGRGMLMLSEMYYPGWQATVNGAEAQIYKVDGGFRGIVVPAGNSRVELRYTPMSFFAGIALSLISSAGTIVAWIWFRKRTT